MDSVIYSHQDESNVFFIVWKNDKKRIKKLPILPKGRVEKVGHVNIKL